MEKWLQEIIPIMDVEHDCILSKQGDISIVFKVLLPEIFTLSDENYESLHQSLIKAIKVLPKETVFHKQDWFITSKYQAPTSIEKRSFLKKSSDKFFKGRPFLDHDCYIILTKMPLSRKVSTSLFSSLIRSNVVPEQTVNSLALQEFDDAASQFQRIVSDSGISLHRLTNEELLSSDKKIGLIERYCFLSEEQQGRVVKDINIKDGLKVGDHYCQLYTLADTENLPSLCSSRINYSKYSTDKTKYSIGFAAGLDFYYPATIFITSI